jgi:hypothetical protein
VTPPQAGPSVDGLVLSLELAPASARVGAAIVAKVTLQNVGGTPRLVNARLALNSLHAPAPFREVLLSIHTPDRIESRFVCKINIGHATEDDLVELAHGASVSARYDLHRYYDLARPGPYTVQASYASSLATPAWTGTLTSNLADLELH